MSLILDIYKTKYRIARALVSTILRLAKSRGISNRDLQLACHWITIKAAAQSVAAGRTSLSDYLHLIEQEVLYDVQMQNAQYISEQRRCLRSTTN